MSFEDLGAPPRALHSLARQGITTPNPVQREAIPALLAGRDVVVEAPTGSGKTLAFLLPLLAHLEREWGAAPPAHQTQGRDGHGQRARTGQGPTALVVAPTRELATQIAEVWRGLDSRHGVAVLFGGVGYGTQKAALNRRPSLVVGCPGRLIDLVQQRCVNFSGIKYLVLDEADEMLDQGFAKDVERLIAMTPKTRQSVLASATMPEWVRQTITTHLDQPYTVRVRAGIEPDVEHGLLTVQKDTKIDTLHELLRAQKRKTIVFHRTKHGAKKLARDLDRRGHFVSELHGNLSQNARDRSIGAFRRGDSWVMVATNVAARGIDIAEVDLIVNYELPDTAEWLVHRVGRTARNGAKGRALTFVSEDDRPQWAKLRRAGAPDLRHVDPQTLLLSGEWVYVAPDPVRKPVAVRHAPQASGPPAARGSESRTQARRPRWQGPRRRAETAQPRHPAGRQDGSRNREPARSG